MKCKTSPGGAADSSRQTTRGHSGRPVHEAACKLWSLWDRGLGGGPSKEQELTYLFSSQELHPRTARIRNVLANLWLFPRDKEVNLKMWLTKQYNSVKAHGSFKKTLFLLPFPMEVEHLVSHVEEDRWRGQGWVGEKMQISFYPSMQTLILSQEWAGEGQEDFLLSKCKAFIITSIGKINYRAKTVFMNWE